MAARVDQLSRGQRPRSHGRLAAVAALLLASIGSAARAATPADVDIAVQRGIKLIYDKCQTDNWELDPNAGVGSSGTGGQYGGATALCTYALLAAGEKPNDNPKLAASIAWLKKAKLSGTYAIGLRAQVWPFLKDDPTVRAAVKQDAELLLAATRGKNNVITGTFFYGLVHPQSPTGYDHSCGQYGVLGMWAVERSGLEVPDAFWTNVETAWQHDQVADGTWSYAPKAPDKISGEERTFNMTAAGVATLFITQDYLRSNEGIRCNGNPVNAPIEKGLAWMSANMPALMKAGKIQMYGIYGIERIGVASGYKYFGDFDWYKGGSNYLVDVKKGNWGYSGRKERDVIGTSLALLFLCRGRAPVVMNKLEYSLVGAGSDAASKSKWNERPRDAANASRYVASQMERDLNWQIVNLKVDESELHDAPILYISGSELLKFSPEDEAKLKAFVENGGMILGNADCGEINFVKGFKALGQKLFPSAGEFRKLETDHPIYTREQFSYKSWKTKPDVLALSNGVREMMILLPSGDPGKTWQLSDVKAKKELFELMSDIFLYAVEGKELREKGVTYIITPNATIKASKTLEVARVNLGSNPDPEPGGWRRLGAVLHNLYHVDVTTTMVKPDAAALKPYKLATLTGTGKTKITDEQMQAIKDYVNDGGTILIDAAGGDSAFGSAVEDTLRSAFAADAKDLDSAIPATDAMYKSTGSTIGPVAFRSFARSVVPRDQTTPLVRGIKVKGRWAVLFSREDLSAGLVGEAVDGVIGYSPESATAVVTQITAYAFGGLKAAPATPAKPVTPAKPATPAKPKS